MDTKLPNVEVNSRSSVYFDIGLGMQHFFSVNYVQIKVRIKSMQHLLFDFEIRFSQFVKTYM